MRRLGFLVVALCGMGCACGARAVPPAGDGAARARQYVIEHRAQLQREVEIGSGAALYELAKVADCQAIAELGRRLHRKRTQIFPVPAPSDGALADQVVTLLADETELVCRDLELGPNRPFSAGRHQVLSSND
jgi:hypothetical protein